MNMNKYKTLRKCRLWLLYVKRKKKKKYMNYKLYYDKLLVLYYIDKIYNIYK